MPFSELDEESSADASARQAANRRNAAASTGPRTAEGKQRSAGNSFKHGLYSRAVVIRGENPAEFEVLRASLRAEHQPANTTEEILVNELAEQFWRLRRFRALDTWAWDAEAHGSGLDFSLIGNIQRALSSAERGFHRSLAALTRLQKDRGFVPAKREELAETQAPQPVPEPSRESAPLSAPAASVTPESFDLGFVPADLSASVPSSAFHRNAESSDSISGVR